MNNELRSDGLYGEIRVKGSLIQSFMICPRQAWLMSRQICPDEDNVYLEIGRFINSQTFKRERKEVHIEHLSLDLIRREDKNLVVAEIKKSSRGREAAKMQLAFYLYELKEMGIAAEGRLLFPEERKTEKLVLDEVMAKKVKKVKRAVAALMLQESPPLPQRIKFCSKCAYFEFCWA